MINRLKAAIRPYAVKMIIGLYNMIDLPMRLGFIPDEIYIKLRWRKKTGMKLKLDAPRGFNEKLQWIKLYDRRSEYVLMADKYLAKEYVGRMIGKEYVIPVIGVWDNADKIDFDKLPENFVLKCNHNSGGGMCICRNKSSLDHKVVRKNLNRELKRDYFKIDREWSYKNIKPLVIAEELLIDDSENNAWGSPINYNFHCFNGEPKFLYVRIDDTSSGKKGMPYLTFLDLDWNSTPFYRPDHPQMPFKVSKPEKFNEMLEIAGKLSKGFPFARVDLYYVKKKILFSEITFFPGGGYGIFEPREWEKKIGDWITLPKE